MKEWVLPVALLGIVVFADIKKAQSSESNNPKLEYFVPETATNQNYPESGENQYSVRILALAVIAVTMTAGTAFAFYRIASSSTNSNLTKGRQKKLKKLQFKLPFQTKDAFIYIKRAYSRLEQGDREGAIADFNSSIRIDPHKAELYIERANFRKIQLSDRHGALEDYTQAICINPQNFLFYFWRSQTYQELGMTQKAIEDYNTAMVLAPKGTIYYNFNSYISLVKR